MDSTATEEAKLSQDATSAAAKPGDDAKESSIGGELLSGLMGAGIAIACILPPLLHLVTGPLGPFIGGFIAANRSKPGVRGRIVIAVTIGTAVTTLVAIAAQVMVSLAGRSQLPSWFPAPGTLAAILCGVWVYATTLGAIGGTVSTALGQKERPST
jgi:protein-S-isoprenylcysteine O-methyltransferase Ste14